MGRRPADEYAVLARAARDQLRRARDLGKSLDNRIAAKRKVSEEYTLTEDDRRDFAAITLAIQHGGKSLAQALEAGAKALQGMTEEQVSAQFAVELVKAATTLTDAQWAAMCDARSKKAKP